MGEQLYGDIDREEAKRRYPEVKDIRDEELREQTIMVVREMPAYHWTAPAAKYHHPPQHQSRHGLWLSTKRRCTAFERFGKSMVHMGMFGWEAVDKGRVACIFADMFKYGVPPTSVTDTKDNHDLLAADWLDNNTALPEAVINAVREHNGAWDEGPKPTSNLSLVVHMADLAASDADSDGYHIKDPHPILREAFPTVGER